MRGCVRRVWWGVAIVALVALVAIPLVCSMAVSLFFYAYEPIPLTVEKVVEIPPKRGAVEVVTQLATEQVIRHPYRFLLMLYVMGWERSLKSGEYAFRFPLRHLDVAQKIVRGSVVRHLVTVVEGATILDVADAVERAAIARKDEIVRLAQDADFIRHATDMNVASLEGYLFPATYEFTKRDTAETVLKRMVREFQRRFKPQWRERAEALHLTVHEVVTMASMVEKEAMRDDERPLIAAVFFNRLKARMVLQSDPTAVYDLEHFKGPITRRHLERPSPYNTYLIKGLPPGPICNPGIASLKAVLFPADVPYLYFVSDRRGSHRFSTTYDEHLRAIKEVMAERAEQQGGRDDGARR